MGIVFGLRAILFACAFSGAVAAAGSGSAAERANPQAGRIVAIGGTITEILYALGAEDRIVARDSTSYYPDEAAEKPDIGYMRQLSAEGILAQSPDLILLEEGSGPAQVIDIIKASEVAVVTIPTPPRADAIGAKIRDIGAAVGLADKAEALAADTERRLQRLAEDVARIPEPRKRVLFMLSLANGRVIAGGAGTEAGAIIELAGGVNAGAAAEGYKPLSDEAVIAARPDVVLGMLRGGHAMTPEQAFAVPALQATPAAENQAVISLDGLLLLGFGPRTPEAGRALASKLYPGAIK